MSLEERESPFISAISIPTSRCFFLGLPFSIRRQIYYEAGLGKTKIINMNFWDRFPRGWSTQDPEKMSISPGREYESYTMDNPCEPDFVDLYWSSLPLSLLSTNHTIHDEVQKILYSEHRFLATFRKPGDLHAVENLSPTAIRELRQLTVVLHRSSCGLCSEAPERTCGCPENHPCMDVPLQRRSSSREQLIEEWTRVCGRLSLATPNQLALYVVCDCQDEETAQSIVAPLASLPLLRDCGIRLAKDYKPEWQLSPEKNVRQMTGWSQIQEKAPFRFLDLPGEIQQQILSYTALVRDGVVIATGTKFLSKQKESARSTFQNHSKEWVDCKQKWDPSIEPMCFCRQSHCAFTFNCDCGWNPSCYFLVSRDFREAAMRVFYASNHFMALAEGTTSSYPDPGTSAWDERDVVAPLPFLEWFLKDSIKYLRHLTIEIDELKYGFGLLTRGGWEQWQNSMQLLLKEATLQALTLELRMDEPFWYADWAREELEGDFITLNAPRGLPERPKHMSDRNLESSREMKMRHIYRKLFEPMRPLNDLKDVFVHLSWRTSEDYFKPDGRRELEQVLEQMVEGDEYDSWSRGKRVCHDIKAICCGITPGYSGERR